jgi:hypothetical protein
MFSKIKSNSKTRSKTKTRKIYNKDDFNSSDGMLTSVWGPSMWHYLHTMSFNYPVNPTKKDKISYKNFILNLKNVLPCKWCRINLNNNLKQLPLTNKDMENRHNFSLYVYKLHELINDMLGKKSGLSFEDVRERYEHFRAHCTIELDKKTIINLSNKIKSNKNKTKKKEKGCTKPLYGKKSKCIIKIVPQEQKCETFQIDKLCIKKR